MFISVSIIRCLSGLNLGPCDIVCIKCKVLVVGGFVYLKIEVSKIFIHVNLFITLLLGSKPVSMLAVHSVE